MTYLILYIIGVIATAVVIVTAFRDDLDREDLLITTIFSFAWPLFWVTFLVVWWFDRQNK
jgi:hypothetical protein